MLNREQIVSAIVIAVLNNGYETLKFILENYDLEEYKIDINALEIGILGDDNTIKTLLNISVSNKSYSILSILIAYGANVNLGSRDGLKPLHIAASIANNDLIDLLIEKGAVIDVANDIGNTALNLASYFADDNTVKNLIKNHGANLETVNKYGMTPIFHAIAQQKLDIIYTLIANGADFRTAKNIAQLNKSLTAIEFAEMHCHNQVIDLLKKVGANEPDETFTTPVHFVAQMDDVDTLDKLLQHEFPIETQDANGNTALHVAAFEGNFDTITKLIAYKANINAKNKRGLSALHFAVDKDYHEVVSLLIASGADINALDNEGHVPLYYAHENAIKELLINSGAEFSGVFIEFAPPLALIAEQKKLYYNFKMVDNLLDKILPMPVVFNSKKKLINMQNQDNKQILHVNFRIKLVNTFTDTIRLINDPTNKNLKALLVDTNHLVGIYWCNNLYSTGLTIHNAVENLSKGYYEEAIITTLISGAFMALPYVVVAMAPDVIATGYGISVTAYNLYHTANNIYDLYQEIYVVDKGDVVDNMGVL